MNCFIVRAFRCRYDARSFFYARKRQARTGRCPANGKEIRIPAKACPAFTPGQAFKDAVDGAGANGKAGRGKR